MKNKWPLFLMVILLFQSCTYVEVSSEYDKSANFNSFRSFNIQPVKIADIYNVNEFAQQRIINAINSELKSRGYNQSSSNADLSIEIDIKTRDKRYTESETTGTGTRYSTYEYTKGTLVIDIIDAKTKRLLWQGIGRGVIDRSPKNREQRLNMVVAKIFKDFPIPKYE